jgi:hypothetical protein
MDVVPPGGPPTSFTCPVMVPVFAAPLGALVVPAAGFGESSPALQPPTTAADITVRSGSKARDLS